MAERDRLYRRFTKAKTPENWEGYRSARNSTKQRIRNARSRYFVGMIEGSASELWRVVRDQGGGRARTRGRLAVPAELFLEHFAEAPADHAPTAPPPAHASGVPAFSFSRISERDVEEAAKASKSRTPGPDGITPQALRLLLPALRRPLAAAFNGCLERGAYPSEWKRTNIFPIPKNNAPTACRDYRPIAVSNCVGRLLDWIVLAQVSAHLERHQVLSATQSAFRRGHNVELALVGVLDPIREAIDGRRLSVVVGMDLARAYDTVDHDLLLDRLRDVGFGPAALTWFRRFLDDRWATIGSDEGPGPGWRRFPVGVPQGSSLSPILFNIFVDGVSRLESACRVMVYPDDILLIADAEGLNLREAIARMNEDVASVCGWLEGSGLVVNPAKCISAIVGNRRMRRTHVGEVTPPIVVPGTPLGYREFFRYLGVTITNDLSWGRQVSQVVSRVHWGLRRLRAMHFRPPAKTRLALVRSLLFPIIDFGLVACSDLTGTDLARLQVAQNACLRFALRPGSRDHVTPLYRREKLLKVRERKAMRTVLTGVKVWKARAPGYVYANLSLLGATHDVATRNADTSIRIPFQRTSRMAGAFMTTFARQFNLLPPSLRREKGANRSKLLEHYLLTMTREQ
ncbi:hypothetical protein J437_LFUL002054 [Ladona fulva]|uniref:Reverse transcriptase domain-containing protein n=1 Tax=Ladona fulva TaxID=123851 RepID=A0A8K0JVE9_LADFU|nr:hypothetical protein J437_LFUL002054 [Ladona fulva]